MSAYVSKGRSSGGGASSFSLGGYGGDQHGNANTGGMGRSSGGGRSSFSLGGYGGAATRTSSRENPFSSAARATMSTGIYSTTSHATGQEKFKPSPRETFGRQNFDQQLYGDSAARALAIPEYTSKYVPSSNSSAVSSNVFAQNANQNCGNVMTGRSSTRVVAPPGGASSFSIGGGYGVDTSGRPPLQYGKRGTAPGRDYGAGAPSHGRGDSQTTTRKYLGHGAMAQSMYNQDEAYARSKGFRQPEVSENFRSGRPSNYALPTSSTDGRFDHSIVSRSDLNAYRNQSAFSPQHAQPQTSQESMHAVSSNVYASGSNQNCGNVMTGRSSTKRMAPPGGHSSFSLG
jgi:SPIRAL1-like protein